MKLGFSTIGCPEWDWAEILGTAKDMGIDGIEIRGVEDELDPMKITIFDKEHLAKTRQQLAQAGIEIAMLASSVTLGSPKGSEEGERQLQQAKNQIDFAAENGIPFVRVLLTLDPKPVSADLEAAEERYCALCNYARNKNVRVLVESCGLFSDTALLGYFVRKATRSPRRFVGHPAPLRHCAKAEADGGKPRRRDLLCAGQRLGGGRKRRDRVPHDGAGRPAGLRRGAGAAPQGL